jgi:hypothetical protein
VLWHSIHVFICLLFFASEASLSALEVVVAALGAFPATGRELASMSLLFSLQLVVHALLAPVATLASLKVVVHALVAVPSAFFGSVTPPITLDFLLGYRLLLDEKWLGIWLDRLGIWLERLGIWLERLGKRVE